METTLSPPSGHSGSVPLCAMGLGTRGSQSQVGDTWQPKAWGLECGVLTAATTLGGTSAGQERFCPSQCYKGEG